VCVCVCVCVCVRVCVCACACVCVQYIASSWNHDGDPVELLQIGALVSRFRRRLRDDPRFLQDKVKHYFQVSLSITAIAVGYGPPASS